MIDPQQLERRPNCVVGLSSQCCSRHAGKNGLLCAVLLLGSLAHLVLQKGVYCRPPKWSVCGNVMIQYQILGGSNSITTPSTDCSVAITYFGFTNRILFWVGSNPNNPTIDFDIVQLWG